MAQYLSLLIFIFELDLRKDISFPIKPRLQSPGFQPGRRYGVDTWANRDHTVAK